MPIRGRRYPPVSKVRQIIYRNPVPRSFVRWIRPYGRIPMPRLRVARVQLTSNVPGPPSATRFLFRRVINRPTGPHISIRTSSAMYQSSAQSVLQQTNRTLRYRQTFARRVGIVNPFIPSTGTPIGRIIHQRTLAINRGNAIRRTSVTVINPPTPNTNRPLYDQHRLARHRTPVPIIYPNRRIQQ